jgi:imidazolonepropionase-like amidohydrolase
MIQAAIKTLLTAVCALTSASLAAQLYEGARLIPGDGGPAMESAAFLVEGGKITQIGKRGEVKAPASVARVDLTGKTVMPTLISTHVHPGFQKGLTYGAGNYTREVILNDLNLAWYYGVSVVMSQGIERGDLAIQIRDEQAAGKLGGAKLLVAGRGIGAPNAGPGALAYKGIAYEVSTEEQIRQAVREQAARKVNAIKIWVDDRGGRAPSLSPALSAAAADEAKKHNLRIAAHVYYHRDAVDLAKAQVSSFAHLVRDAVMDEPLLVSVIKNRVFVMPNMGGAERNTHTEPPGWWTEPYLAGLLKDSVSPEVIERMKGLFAPRDPKVVEQVRAIYRNIHRNTTRLKDAGARIILGSDTGLPDHLFGYAEQRELELMRSAGMTEMEVIVAATSRAAEYLQLPDHGTLAAGKRADFLVLDGNPLDDIRNTRRIARMFIGGKEIDRAALKAALII